MVVRKIRAMAKAARRYDVYLPLTFNNGAAIPDEHFDRVERTLLRRFGGVTAQQREFPFRGTWQGTTQRYLDEVIVMTALDFRRGGSSAFVASLKKDILRRFDQLEILITESTLHVH
jgi:hypothetical protein